MKKHFLYLLSLIFILSSCSQVKRMKNLNNCEFKLTSIDILEVDNNDVSKIKSASDIDFITGSKLVLALFSENAKIKYKLNFRIMNPNNKPAGVKNMDVLVYFNEKELARGGINQSIYVGPNNQADVSLIMTSDISEFIKNISTKDILNLLFTIDGGISPLFLIKVKPSVSIGKYNLKYPGYFTVNQDFKSN